MVIYYYRVKMQEMRPSHYQLFGEKVSNGIFDNHSIGKYMRKIYATAEHLVFPIKYEDIAEALELSTPEFISHVVKFQDKGIEDKKVIPLDGLVCIEDDISAVFAENNYQRERSFKLTEFGPNHHIPGLNNYFVSSGLVKILNYSIIGTSFDVSDVYGAFIEQDSVILATDMELRGFSVDLVNSAATVIEQLTYLHLIGSLPRST